ncbi:MAG: GH36-type glycosyl hydrolase domain-containing protein [Roseburia sp.]
MKNEYLGEWKEDIYGLPCFQYKGEIPYSCQLSNGQKVKLPQDPWFLLGNYQLTLFSHVSGEYELITGQRSWGRMNQGSTRNSGANESYVKIFEENEDKIYNLVGVDSAAGNPRICNRVFGCGFADYSYSLDGVSVERNISVKPSTSYKDGLSAFILSVKIKNNRTRRIKAEFTESVTANYVEIQYQEADTKVHPVQYEYSVKHDEGDNTCMVLLNGIARDPLLLSNYEEMSPYEGFPPALFIRKVESDWTLTINGHKLCADLMTEIEPNGERLFHLIIGYAFENEELNISKICHELLHGADLSFKSLSVYSNEWKKILPAFEDENDGELRRELIWHAYNLHAMATYSEYYQETKIPQGTIYDYDWGVHASARDNYQHALPLVYYNPELAKSVLRYMMKRTTPYGEIRLVERGNGYCSAERYFTSDQQLFFFLLLGEYLRVTKDYDFLNEKVQPYPYRNQAEMSVLQFIEKCFAFLRDEIATGEHGLVRLLNSDWNDAVYYIVKAPYNSVLLSGESHMNSAMAIVVLQTLIKVLQEAKDAVNCKKISLLIESMRIYRESVLEAFIKDMGERTFSKRMYFAGRSYGDDNMFLEPQGYTLLIDEISQEKKKALYQEMQKRVYDGEILGAREQEKPEFEDAEFDKGSRENGGFWWALNGPVIMGVSKFDREEAMRLLKNMTFAHFSEKFPQYWTSYWSAADNIESSLIIESGLPDQSLSYSNIPVYCAHPHAWILYCYYYLNERR